MILESYTEDTEDHRGLGGRLVIGWFLARDAFFWPRITRIERITRMSGLKSDFFYPQITQMDTDKGTSVGWNLWLSVTSVDDDGLVL